MAFVTRQYDNAQELTDYLNGIVLSASLPPGKIFGLDGLTLIINDGAAKTVTFADPTNVGLALPEIIAQIEAVSSGFATLRNYGHIAPPKYQLAFVGATDQVLHTGTANTILGLGTSGGPFIIGGAAVAIANIVAVFNMENNRIGVIHE